MEKIFIIAIKAYYKSELVYSLNWYKMAINFLKNSLSGMVAWSLTLE